MGVISILFSLFFELCLFDISFSFINDGKLSKISNKHSYNTSSASNDMNLKNKIVQKDMDLERRKLSKPNNDDSICPSRNHLYFLITSTNIHNSKNNGLLSPKNITRCALRSACYLNPELTVEVMTVDENEIIEDIKWLKKSHYGCTNIKVSKIDVVDILKDTPLLALYDNSTTPNLFQGFSANNIGNALRLALLYKYGGAYLDLDVITLRSFKHIPCNSVASQVESSANKNNNITVNNAAMFFNSNSPFIRIAMDKFVKEFDPHRWGYQGPNLLKRSLRTIINRSNTVKKYKSKHKYREVHAHMNVNILHKESFYPLGIDVNKQIRPFFTAAADPSFLKNGFGNDSIGIHLWNHHSQLFLNKGIDGEKGGWTVDKNSIPSLLMQSCLLDQSSESSESDMKPFQLPFFSKNAEDVKILQNIS